jgi:hypothetical protein
MMPAVIERLCEAINQHDPDAMVECFDPDYRSEQPAHPNRGFGARNRSTRTGRPCSRASPTSRSRC